MSKLWQSDENVQAELGIPRGEYIAKKLIDLKLEINSILDICCGRGFVLEGLKLWYPEAACYGLDMEVYDVWNTWDRLFFIKALFQEFIKISNINFDLVLMLETWRNWTDRPIETRMNTIKWLQKHTKYFICSGPLHELEDYEHLYIGDDNVESRQNCNIPISLVYIRNT